MLSIGAPGRLPNLFMTTSAEMVYSCRWHRALTFPCSRSQENRRMPSRAFAVAAFALTLPIATAAQQASGPYKVLRTVKIGGEGGFDYVTADPDGRNLYVARSGPAGHIGVYN